MITCLLLTAALAAAPGSPLAPQASSPGGFSPATSALKLGRRTDLKAVVDAFEVISQQPVLMEDGVAEGLANQALAFDRDVEVPADRALAWFEALLYQRGYALASQSQGGQLALRIVAPGSSKDSALEGAIEATQTEILAWSNHRALLVRHSLNPDRVDARQLANSLRTLVSHPALQSMEYDRESESLVLTGPIAWVRNIVLACGTAPTVAGNPAVEGPRYEPAGEVNLPAQATLEELLIQEGERSGTHFVWDADTGRLLRNHRISLGRDLKVPHQRTAELIDLLLAESGCATFDYGSGDSVLMAVTRKDSARHAQGRFVEHLAGAAPAASRMVMTVVDLPGVDARQLSNSWRTFVSDARRQLVLPMGSLQHVLLAGPQEWVREQQQAMEVVSRASLGEPLEPGILNPRPEVRSSLRIQAGDSLLGFLEQVEAHSSARFLTSEEIRGQLRMTPCGLLGESDMEATQAFATFEQLMADAGYVFSDFHGMLLVSHVGPNNRGITRHTMALGVPGAELARRPAGRFTSLLHLPQRDVRQLSNSLRMLITSAFEQRMIPMGSTSAILLQGTGSWIQGLSQLLGAGSQSGLQSSGDWSFEQPLSLSAGSTLLEACAAVQARTGQIYAAGEDVRAQLSAARLADEFQLKGSRARSAWEQLLAGQGYFLSPGAPGSRIERIQVTGSAAPPGAQQVSIEDLDQLLERPATMVSLTVELPGVDVRRLMNSWRGLITNMTNSMLAMGREPALTLRGTGPWVAETARLLQLATTETSSQAGQQEPLAPSISSTLILEPNVRLLDALEQFEAAASAVVLIDAATRSELASQRLELPTTLRVPGKRALRTFSNLLLEHGFSLSGRSPIFTVCSNGRLNEATAPAARTVASDALAAWADQPSQWVQTVVNLPGVDVSKLARTNQAAEFRSAPGRALVALEDPGRMILVGPASEVANLALSLRQAQER